MSQKLFELIESMTGYECQKDELNEIIEAVKQVDAPDGWFCPILPKHIPSNFEWVAMDKNGSWFAYEQKPKKDLDLDVFCIFYGDWGRIAINTNPDINWEETLQKIPR